MGKQEEDIYNDAEHKEHLPLSQGGDPFNTEHLSYGESGLKGLIAAPYIFAASLLASLAGFSFGYGTSLSPLLTEMFRLTEFQIKASFH